MADRPYFVFYGTRTAIVQAQSEAQAYRRFVEQFSPEGERGGRLLPPTRAEVRIRRPVEADRGWIADSGDKRFLAALPKARARARG